VLLDHQRSRHGRETPLPVDDSTFEGLVDETEKPVEAIAVRDLLDRLPAADARLLTLAYLEGFRANEIAAMSGASEGAVRMALLRARNAFRSAWQGTTDEGITRGQ
jgi:RNA polymerase sigma-70 factor, ECF subfamily